MRTTKMIVVLKKVSLTLVQDHIQGILTSKKLAGLLFKGGSFLASLSILLLYCTKHELLPLSFLRWLSYEERNPDWLQNPAEPLSVSKRVKKGHPPGIVNSGNGCFTNCVLQALSSLEASNSWISKMSLLLDNDYYTVVPSLCQLTQALSNKKYLFCENCTTSNLIGSLRAHGWVIPYGQQDAHEFYQVLMSTVDEEIIKYCSTPDIYGLSTEKECSGRKKTKGYGSTIWVPVSPYKGLLASRLTCLTCGYKFPVKLEHFDSISLRLPSLSYGIVTLESCLHDYVSSERVDDVICSGCQGRRSSFSKEMFLAKVPKCLCLQIQRTYHQNNGVAYKNPTYVKFPELLDVFPFSYNQVVGNQSLRAVSSFPAVATSKFGAQSVGGNPHKKCKGNQTGKYKLKASVVHHGDLLDGHFITYRRNLNMSSTDWVYISDTLVKQASLEDVLSCNAYLLFYERSE